MNAYIFQLGFYAAYFNEIVIFFFLNSLNSSLIKRFSSHTQHKRPALKVTFFCVFSTYCFMKCHTFFVVQNILNFT